MNNSVCYVCCFYLGDRRDSIQKYNLDKTLFVREQIKSLQETEHKLGKIVFVFNLEEEHKTIYEKIKNEIPSKIKNTEVEVIERENYGMSYAAFSQVYGKYRTDFEYYIFNEDDYYFNIENFDTYLINKFNSYVNIGYLAALVTNPAYNFLIKNTYAGNSVGITKSIILEKLWDKFGCLPHAKNKKGDDYKINESDGQVAQTNEIFKLGYNIYDIREDYSCPHSMGNNNIDHFFFWNKPLIIPASVRFEENVRYTNIIDAQFQPKKSCYVVNFYFGDRRRTVPEFESDRLIFLKKQIETLSIYYHNLDKIIFNFNVEKEHYDYLSEALNIIPKKVQNTEVEVLIRENKGFSYATFSESFKRNKEKYDYFIFNEDDYFVVENNWDEYLIRTYNMFPKSGYLCPLQRDAEDWNGNKIHAGHCFGIASTKSLNKVWDKYGKLPHNLDNNDYKIQEKVQYDFTYSFVEVGLRVYDIREDYRVQFAMTNKNDHDIWRLFWWNEKDFIVPAIILLNKRHTWWQSFDGPFERRTNLEKYT